MTIAKLSKEITKQLKNTTNIAANSGKILNNRILLYVILIIVVIDMFLFVRVGEVFYIFLYILFGILVALQTSNMMVILASAFVLTNIVKYAMRSKSVEGFNSLEGFGQQIIEALGKEDQEYFRGIADGKNEPLTGLEGDEKDAYDQIIAYLTGEEDKEGEDKEDKESEEKVKDETKKVENPVEKIAGFKSDSNTTIEGLEEDAARLIKTQKTLKENMAELQPMLKKAEKIMSDLKNLNA